MRVALILLLLCSTAFAQTVPPGVNPSQRTIGRIEAGLIRAEVGHGGGLHGLHLLSPSGWCNVSTPANYRPQSQSEDGWCIWTGAAAIDATQRSIVQGNAATAVLRGAYWQPQPSQALRLDSVGSLGVAPHCSSWACFDSVLGELVSPPLYSDVLLSRSDDGLGIETVATVYRGAGLPQFTYERWTAPYLVLDGKEVLGVIVEGNEIPIASVPQGVPLVVSPLTQSAVVVRTRCGRWLIVLGNDWDIVQLWRPHERVLIVACVVNAMPVTPTLPVVLEWEVSAQ